MDIIKYNVNDIESSLNEIRENIKKKHKATSKKKTPDGKVKQMFGGFSYVEEHYMRDMLNEQYPLWSWENADNIQFLGSEWVVVSGTLSIEENGIIRKFYSIGAKRVTFKSGMPHTPENIIDIDNDVASANSFAFKRAVNRLCNIADDIYRIGKELTAVQIKDILELAKETGQHDNIKKLIDDGEINPQNYTIAMRKLSKLKH